MSSSSSSLQFPSVTKLVVDSVDFLQSVNSPASSKSLFLGGAGIRGLEVNGNFLTFSVMGVYLDAVAVPLLAVKWKCKTTEELTDSVPFFRQIVTGEFEKLIKVTIKLPLTGQQYSEKVMENCVEILKTLGFYTDYEAKSVKKFLEIFKEQSFSPGASIFFALSPNGPLTIWFSKDESIQETAKEVIDDKLLGEALLESIIGKNGVSPATRLSLAERLVQLMKNNNVEEDNLAKDK